MSARRIEGDNSLNHVTLEGRQALLSLSPDAIIVHKNGIEFRSVSPFPAWTEVTMTLQSPGESGKVHCNGVVIACTGNKHTGYHISMVLTGLSRQAEARLNALALSQRA
jgi:hypothetical protein